MGDNVSFGELVKATVKVSNSVDGSRTVDISSDVTVSGNHAEDFYNSSVHDMESHERLCSFNNYGGHLDISFDDCTDIEKMVLVLQSVCAFISDVREKVEQGVSFTQV